MLSWFAKLDGAGYLWFVTAMAFAYLFAVVLSRCSRIRRTFLALGVGAALLSLVMWVLHLRQGYFVVFMFGFAIAFLDDIFTWVGGGWGLVSVCVVSLVVLHTHYNITPWIALLAAMGIVRICRRISVMSAVIKWLSDMSYEIYLVHSLFVFGTVIPLKALFGDGLLFVINYVVCSLIGAYMLRKVVDVIFGPLARKISHYSIAANH